VHNRPPIRLSAVALLRRFHMDVTFIYLIINTRRQTGNPPPVRLLLPTLLPARLPRPVH
jgi:hypothetical protein